jgi:hypothetical protein
MPLVGFFHERKVHVSIETRDRSFIFQLINLLYEKWTCQFDNTRVDAIVVKGFEKKNLREAMAAATEHRFPNSSCGWFSLAGLLLKASAIFGRDGLY